MKKWIKLTVKSIILVFAIIGFFLCGSYVAIQLNLTKEGGIIDQNNRYFGSIHDKYNQEFKKIQHDVDLEEEKTLERILLLKEFYPVNASYILDAFKNNTDIAEINRMLAAVELSIGKNRAYLNAKKKLTSKKKKISTNGFSVFEWMNIAEWQTFKEAVVKDKNLIDSAANATGVEARLIVSCLVGEQIRLFNSSREAYKKWIGPLKILSVERSFSFGVTGIKEATAMEIEKHLKDPSSPYYTGKTYEHLLDFQSSNPSAERMQRLTSYKNHYYSYLYAALFLKQVKIQWERAGFPIGQRPEILATLFNVGYIQSQPKKDPKVGGSSIQIHDKKYSFGAIAYQFYYSGELFDEFPLNRTKFKEDAP